MNPSSVPGNHSVRAFEKRRIENGNGNGDVQDTAAIRSSKNLHTSNGDGNDALAGSGHSVAEEVGHEKGRSGAPDSQWELPWIGGVASLLSQPFSNPPSSQNGAGVKDFWRFGGGSSQEGEPPYDRR